MKQKLILLVVGVVVASALFIVGCDNMQVNEAVRKIPIIEPYISVQPLSYSFFYEGASGNNAPAAYPGTPPELEVDIFDWEKADGSVSFQWYTFESVEKYCAGEITAIPGATDKKYTPTGIKGNEEGVYFYYAVITNDFPSGTNKKSAKIQSEVAVISISNPASNGTVWPILTKQPVSAAYQLGRTASVAALEVRATLPVIQDSKGVPTPLNGSLSYQWYSNTTGAISGGTKIEGATSDRYMPDFENMKRGSTFYYVEVTNTNFQGNSKTITCLPVSIDMLPGEKAQEPTITEQPRDQRVFDAANIKNLTIAGTSKDGGTISYQWYSANTPAATVTESGTGSSFKYTNVPPVPTKLVEGTDGVGVTSASFKPAITAGQEKYYWAEIINTVDENDVEGEPVAKVWTKIVTVKVQAATTEPTTVHSTIVLPDDYATFGSPSRLQYIRGFGGMDVAWANFPNTTEAETELQYNPDWGLGYNMLRIMVTPPGTDDPNYTTHAWILDEKLLSKHRPDYIKNVQVVNKYGGYVLASPWTPPKEWKTNNSINSGGHLKPSNYKAFANYLRSFAQEMYYRGAPIYAISIANEPNYAGGYDGCEWSADQMRDFWKEVGHFTDGVRGYGGGKYTPVVLTMNGESANNPNINFSALNDPISRAAMDIFARHVYGNQKDVLWTNDYADWKEGSTFQTECWMTEHNINSANPTAYPQDSTWNYVWRFMNDIDLVIRLNSENAFVWWASKRFYSMIGDDQFGTKGSEGKPTVRGYGLSHYAKYTNGFTRIKFSMTGTLQNGTNIGTLDFPNKSGSGANQVTNYVNNTGFSLDSLDTKITAYASPDGNEISFVMFTPTNTSGGSGNNMGTIQIKMPTDFLIGSAKAQYSDATHNMVEDETLVIASDRKSAYVTLPASKLLSVKFIKQ